MNLKYLVTTEPKADVLLISDPFSKELLQLWYKRKMKGNIFQVYNEEDNLIGYVLLEINNRTSYKKYVIRGTYIDPVYRGLKVGENLIEEVLSFIPSNEKCWVNITESALDFYLKQGFEVVNRREDFPDQFVAFKTVLL